MDQFKFNAAKMIAAQKKKSNHRPISPESESNWDSSDAENTAPHISSSEEEEEEQSIASNKAGRSSKPADKKVKSATLGANSHSKHLKHNNLLVNGSLPIKSSPAASIRSGTSSKKGSVTMFVDNRGFDSDSDDKDPVSSVNSKVSLKKSTVKKDQHQSDEKKPPYDFRGALQDPSESVKNSSGQQRPGKSRKGNAYDPGSKNTQPMDEKGTGSWDDSEEERELQAIRREMEKHNKQDVSSSSPETKAQAKSSSKSVKNWVVKPRERLRNPKPPNEPSPRTSKHLMAATTTTSDVELRNMVHQEGAADSYEQPTRIPTLPVMNSTTDQRYIYHYDHGSTGYYDTRHGRQDIYMTNIADKSERLVKRCTLEVFAALRIVADFFIIVILELLRFIAYHIIGVFLVGLLTTFGDYLFKPVLAAFFNAVLQPLTVFMYNIAIGFRTIMSPVIDIVRALFTQIAMLLRAFRLFELNWRTNSDYSNERSIHEV